MSTRERIPSSSSSDGPPEASESLIGRTIDDRYRIEALVGTGGMGNVYRAEHVKIQRPVALKVLHWQMGQIPEVSKRFEREAVAIGRIDHPNCVRVSDFGQLEDGSLYLVLEYVEGASLLDVLGAELRLDYRRALHIGVHVLRGLAHVHEAGIIHRDIKPENILLLERDGDADFAKILDFGIAKLIGEAAKGADAQLTQGTSSFGTPAYMSPEQVVGDPVDVRTDLYSLSIVLYQAITGHAPFEGEDLLAVMQMHTSNEVPPMAEVAPDLAVPEPIELLIRRGLEKRPENRYATALDYLEAIEAALEASASETFSEGAAETKLVRAPIDRGEAPAGAGEEGVAGKKRSRGKRFAVGAGGLLALAAAVGIAWGFAARDPGPGAAARQARELLDKGEPREAIAYLEERRPRLEEAPYAILELGHAYAAVRRQREAIEAYRQVFELDEEVMDGRVRTNLLLMTDEEEAEVVVPALELLVRGFDDEEARRRLIELAEGGEVLEVRAGARDLAEELGLGDRIDRTASYALDLEQASSCEERREVVARLRALGDKRAIDALEEALARTDAAGRPVNDCLREDAEEAIEYFERAAAAKPE